MAITDFDEEEPVGTKVQQNLANIGEGVEQPSLTISSKLCLSSMPSLKIAQA